MNKASTDTFYKARILVVDDEPGILLGLRRQLTARGYEVKTATSGLEALDEKLRTKELAPRLRKPIGEIAFAGFWGRSI